MKTKSLRLALALAALLCASAPALASDCLTGSTPGNKNQCYPTFVLIDPTTGAPPAQFGTSQTSPIYASESAANIATSQATASTTANPLCAARPGRRAVTIENLGATAVTLGGPGVTTSTGILLPGAIGQSITIPTSAAIYGLTSAGSQAVACLETY